MIELGCEVSADQLRLPEASDVLASSLHAAALQMISYFAALAKGTDVDQSKNLAKSVTIE